MSKWEAISDALGCRLERIQVPGGWLYRTIAFGLGEDSPPAAALAFVPQPRDVVISGAPWPMGHGAEHRAPPI